MSIKAWGSFAILIFIILNTNLIAQTTGSVLFVDGVGVEALNYGSGESVRVRVVDADVNTGSGSVQTLVVRVSSPTEPAGEELTLSETGNNTGVFEGSIATGEATASADGVLQVSRGEQLVVVYEDASNDFGNAKSVQDQAFYGVTLVSGVYSANETWRKAQSPYLVTGDVTVTEGARLTIEPGVEVRFLATSDDQSSGEDNNRSELRIQGQLEAIGTVQDSIVFTSNAQDPANGDWYGIYITGDIAHTISYAVIEYSTWGIFLNSLTNSESIPVTISNNIIRSGGRGIYSNYVTQSVFITSNVFSDITGEVIRYSAGTNQGYAKIIDNVIEFSGTNGTAINSNYGREVEISDNTITNRVVSGERPQGVYASYADKLTVSGQYLQGMSTAIYIREVDEALIRGNTIEENGSGIYVNRTDALVDSNTVINNQYDGIRINTDFENPVIDTLRYNTITGNGQDGIENNGHAKTVAQYNNIHGNGGYDYRNNSSEHAELDARFNWWGEATTAVMDLGSNPKDIDKIYDQYDNNGLGFVNYGGWLDGENGTPSSTSTTGSVLFVDGVGVEALNYGSGESVRVRVVDADVNTGSGSVQTLVVRVSSPTEPAGEELTLSETGNNTGVFEGSIATGEATASADGVLQVSRGEQLVVVYEDASDDFGNAKSVQDQAFYGVTLVSGVYSANETWRKAQSPYLVTGDVTVTEGARLTIEPGVEVRFLATSDDQSSGEDNNRSELRIQGQLEAIGTVQDSIVFTSNAQDPANGDWYGIYITGDIAHTISYAVIEYSTWGIFLNSLTNSESIPVTISNNIIRSGGRGIYSNYVTQSVFITSNVFSDITGEVIRYSAGTNQGYAKIIDNVIEFSGTNGTAINSNYGREVEISDNTITNRVVSGERPQGVYASYADKLTVSGQYLQGMSTAIYIREVDEALIRGNTIEENGSGIYVNRTDALVDSNTVINNQYDGIRINTDFENPVIDTLRYNTITGNGQDGIENNGHAKTVAQYNNIHGNGGYDYRNNSSEHAELDARFNWWGEATTAVMDLGSNPKDIDKIYDQYDNNGLGFVNYGGWLDGENGTPSSTSTTGSVLFVDGVGVEALNYGSGESVRVRVVDADVNTGSGSVQTLVVRVSSPTEPAGEELTLSETGNNTGVFEGSIATGEATASADGVLQVSRGEQLVVVYEDASDDFGNAKSVQDQAFYGVTLVSGVYSANETWRKAQSPYLVTGDVTVTEGARLTIEPGVEVRFLATSDDQSSGEDNNRSELRIQGQLEAIGTVQDSIVFTSNAQDPANGDWYGIYITGDIAHTISYAVIEYSTWGIFLNSLTNSESIPVTISNNIIRSGGRGIYSNYVTQSVFITSNVFSDITGEVIRYSAGTNQGYAKIIDNVIEFSGTNGTAINSNYGREVEISDNTITNRVVSGERPQGVYASYADKLTVSGQYLQGMSTAIYIREVDEALIRGNTIEENGSGIYVNRTDALVDSNTVINNQYDGIRINTDFENPVIDTLRYNTITGNGQDGIENNGHAKTVAQYNNIHGNGGYDYRNNSSEHAELDARFNWWGEATTAVMDLGSNPKDIDKIYDQYDNNGLGFVNYGGWLDGEVDHNKIPSIDTIVLSVTDYSGFTGDTIYGEISLDGFRNSVIESFQLTLNYNVDLIEFELIEDEGYNLSTFTYELNHTNNGTIFISGSNAFGFNENGEFIKFKAIALAEGSSEISITDVLFNEGQPFSIIENGHVEIIDFVCGDVTGDLTLSALDAVHILRHTVYLKPEYPISIEDSVAADVTGNGQITAFDATQILKKLVGLPTNFNCGSVNTKKLDLVSEIDFTSIKKEDEIIIPIDISNYSGIEINSMQFEISGGGLSLFKGIRILSDNADVVTNQVENSTKISLYDVYGFAADTIGYLVFENSSNQNQEIHIQYIVNEFNSSNERIIIEKSLPTQFSLSQNYPNPFNPSTNINFELPNQGEVKLQIFNVVGQLISTLVDKKMDAGSYSFKWDASNFSSGTYFYRITYNNQTVSKKMILMK